MKIVIWNDIDEIAKTQILARPMLLNKASIKKSVVEIINAVKEQGDKALYALTQKYDQVSLADLHVTQHEIEAAIKKIKPDVRAAIDLAIRRITHYHKYFLPTPLSVNTQDGIHCERIVRPIQRVGLYVPGGTAPLVSTLMMLAVPAQVAACPTRIMATPPNQNGELNPHLLYTAQRCGIDKIVKLGGAQAIAAMAFGTKSVPKVDKLFGPGNAWVTQAKLAIAQDPWGASIDLPAGPSEVMIVADKNAKAAFIAADLLSQAEHGAGSQAILITNCRDLAQKVLVEIETQLNGLDRKNLAVEALRNSSIILVDKIEDSFSICNQYAPEHLILQLKEPRKYLAYIQCAGAIFLGHWTPETLGDYVTGSNHVLPTYGYAKNYSGLSVSDYMIAISVQEASYSGLKKLANAAMTLASTEGLEAHKAAISVRLNSKEFSEKVKI